MINVEVMCNSPSASGILAKVSIEEEPTFVRIKAEDLDNMLAQAERSTDWFSVTAATCKFAQGVPYTVVMSDWATDATEHGWRRPYKLFADVLARAVVEHLIEEGLAIVGNPMELLDEYDVCAIVSRVCEHYETGKPLDECGY